MQFHDELKQLLDKYRDSPIPENSIPCQYVERAYNSFNVVMTQIQAEVNGIWSQEVYHHANPPPLDLVQ